MKFLGRAKKLLKGMAESPRARVQYFNVLCPSGHRIRGERTLGYQALRCPGCGEGVFILPLSPLPEPSPPPRPTTSKRTTPRDKQSVVDEPIRYAEVPASTEFSGETEPDTVRPETRWEDAEAEFVSPPAADAAGDAPREPAEGERQASLRIQRTKVDSPSQSRPSNKSRRPADPGGLAEDSDEFGDGSSRRHPRRSGGSRRPLLVFGAVGLLVVCTLGFRAWRNRRLELPGIYDLGRTEGIAALDGGRFDRAHQLLAAAKRAVDSLGGGLEGEDEVRQAAAEAAIFVDLASETLEEMLNEAGPREAQDWESRFRTFYAGHSVVIDTRIAAIPSAENGGTYLVDYMILPPGEATIFREDGTLEPSWRARIDFSDFELFNLAKPEVGQRVLFGAKLGTFTREADSWVIRFQPKSGVFLTHTEALESLGWPGEVPPPDKPAEAE